MANEAVFTTGLYINEVQLKKEGAGSIIKLDFKVDEFIKFLQANKNEKGYCKVDVFKNKPESTSKNTHYGVLNIWKPESPNPVTQKPKIDSFAEELDENSDDLPF